MKTKLFLFILAVAAVTLSFTFVTVSKPSHKQVTDHSTLSNTEPVGGIFADQVK